MSHFFVGRGSLVVVVGIMIIGTGPCEDKDEVGCNPEETGKTRTLSLMRALPILPSPLSRYVVTSIGRSACS